MLPITEASLADLKADFLRGSDFARLVALNAAIEAARAGGEGEAMAAVAVSSDQRIRRAIESSEHAAKLLRDTLGDCMLPLKRP